MNTPRNALYAVCLAMAASGCQNVAPPAAGIAPLAASTAAAATPPAAAAGTAPDSDIFIADLDLAKGAVTQVRNVTRHPGYDNQPAFVPGSDALWFVSGRNGATDVYRYDIGSGATTRVSATAEAEFSPTPLPDGSGFSVTRVGAPGSSGEAYTESQQLWRYSADGKPLGSVLPAGRVGYHAWLDGRRVALFLVGNAELKQANTLVLADLATGAITPMAASIGRSLARTPDGKRISFVDKRDPARWTVVAIAPGEAAPSMLVAVPASPAGTRDSDRSEDICWLPDGSLLMAQEGQLLRWNGQAGAGFVPFAGLKGLGGAIKRLAVSADGKRLAFVVQMR